MASVSKQANGRRRIQFMGADGKRKSIRLGKVSQRMAEAVKLKVEHLVAAAQTGGALDSETARWTAEIGDDLADKLAAVDLIPKRERATLSGFLGDHIDGRVDIKPASRVILRHVRRDLEEFFGPDRPVRKITPGEAEDFRLFLVGEKKLAPSTIAKRLQRARQMFAAMKRRRLIEENPFAEVKHAEGDVTGKQRFIGRDETTKLIDAAPDWVWRTIIALARYGGLRCPSEVLSLKLADIDWENSRLRVTSPKTEHHPGGASRVIPIFPELRPFLDEVWEMAAEREEYIIPSKYRTAALGAEGWRNCNLRTQFLRIVKRAGLEPWPRPFHNLRSSRETELAAAHPVHVAADWLGNSPRIALKHYLQTTEADFQKAVQNQVQPGADSVQKQVQPVSADVRQEMTEPQGSLGVRLESADSGETWQESLVAGTGFEPATSRL